MEFRSYQPPAIEWISRRRRGLVVAKAGAGKTIIAAAGVARVVLAKPRNRKVRVGWIAPTIEMCQQAHAALDLFPDGIRRKVACAAGSPDMSNADVLIVDEAAHALAPLWRAIIERCTGAVWGFTATPCLDDPDKHAELVAFFGGELFTVDPREVAKVLARGRVRLLSATDPDMQQPMDAEIDQRLTAMVRKIRYGRPGSDYGALREEFWPRVAYRVCLDIGIMANGARNAAVIATARKHAKDSALILVNNKDHGAILAPGIPGAVVAHSKMGKKERAAAIEGFRDGSIPCLIATSLADEGADFPRANVLIMACGGKAAGRVEQRTGRVLRAFAGKVEGLIYDFTDADVHPLMASQARKRQAVYRELGYTIETSTHQMALL